MNYSQEFSPLSIKEQMFFRDTQSTLKEQLDQANEKVNQLLQYNQQLSEELERMHILNNELKMQQPDNSKDKEKENDQAKFINCVLNMVKVCHPQSDKEINLKYAWKWLKYILEDYIELKKKTKDVTKPNKSEVFKANTYKNCKKDSIVVGDLLKKNYQVVESQYLQPSNCR